MISKSLFYPNSIRSFGIGQKTQLRTLGADAFLAAFSTPAKPPGGIDYNNQGQLLNAVSSQLYK